MTSPDPAVRALTRQSPDGTQSSSKGIDDHKFGDRA
jgi:hypothetical protein